MTMSWVIGLLLVGLGASSSPARTLVHPHHCHDGDTCTVTIPKWPAVVGEKIPVRIFGIDAPEIKGRCDQEHELALQAKTFLESTVLLATRVEISEVRRDKYFRLRARLWADGREVGPLLVTRGLARPYFGGTRQGWCGH